MICGRAVYIKVDYLIEPGFLIVVAQI
jgi:hypothetical protein